MRRSVRGKHNCFVTANRGHRRKHVHALRACRSRHQFHGKRGHSLGGDFLNRFDGAQRPQESNEYLPAAEQRNVGLAGPVVRSIAENLNHDVGGPKEIGAVGDNLCAFCGIVRVWITGADSGSGFHHNFQARLCQMGNSRGHQRDSALSRKTLSGHTYKHEASSDVKNQKSGIALGQAINSTYFKKGQSSTGPSAPNHTLMGTHAVRLPHLVAIDSLS